MASESKILYIEEAALAEEVCLDGVIYKIEEEKASLRFAGAPHKQKFLLSRRGRGRNDRRQFHAGF